MNISDYIRQAVQARGPRGRLYRIRRIKRSAYPTAQAIAYANSLERPINYLINLVETNLISNAGMLAQSAAQERRHDEYGRTLDDIIRLVEQEFTGQWPDEELARLARAEALKLSEVNRRQLTRILSNALGVPVFFQDGWAAPEIVTWINTNVSLIKSVKDQHLGDVRSMVTSSIRSGRTVQNVMRDIRDRYANELADKPRNRAELLARDQIGKFYGNANQLRQRELGIERYVWRGVLDQRERDSHREKEGNIYRWDDPPSDTGHPGEDFQCRCIAEPYLADEVPKDIPNREAIMKDIQRQQQMLSERQRIEIPEPPKEPEAQIPLEGSPEEDESERIFGKPSITGGTQSKRTVLVEAIRTVAEQLGPNATKTPLPKIVIGRLTGSEGMLKRWGSTGKMHSIVIKTNGAHQKSTLAHEMGHLIDAYDAINAGYPTGWMSGVGGQALNQEMHEVMDAIKSSPEYNYIKTQTDEDGATMPLSAGYRSYLMRGYELFARAFSQYIAVESKDKDMLQGIDQAAASQRYFQWTNNNFKPIRKAIKKYLKGRR